MGRRRRGHKAATLAVQQLDSTAAPYRTRRRLRPPLTHLTVMLRRCPSAASAEVISNSARSARTDRPGSARGPIIVCVLPLPVWP